MQEETHLLRLDLLGNFGDCHLQRVDKVHLHESEAACHTLPELHQKKLGILVPELKRHKRHNPRV